MYSSLAFSTLVCLLLFTIHETNAVKSLCDDPIIHAADRMANNTYRVYRGDYYWDLIGLPEKVVQVNGPYKNWWANFGPLTRDTAVFTVVGGAAHGMTYKLWRGKMWSWNSAGRQRDGGKSGLSWSGFPKGMTFSAAFNDGDLDKKGYPMMIAFSGITAYYFRTSSLTFQKVGEDNGYQPPGQFNEDFPGDLTAAMAFPSDDEDVKYYVYLFKQKKYCFRPITGEKKCKKWRENKELFGCLSNSGGGGAKEAPKESAGPPPAPEPEPEGGDDGNSGPIERQNIYLFLFIVFLSNILM